MVGSGKPSRQTLNALTVDVEEHFQVSAFEHVVCRSDWRSHPSRVRRNTDVILDFLDEAGVRGTFFVLGWVAENHPDLVREIATRGHEVASHGWSHTLVYDQTVETFRDEVDRSRKLLQDLSGQEVTGHRAASFSIILRSLWALDVLAEVGFRYDSSVFPVRHDRYGVSHAPRSPFRFELDGGRELVEVPPATVNLAGHNLPAAGGGYLRLYPSWLTHWILRRLNGADRIPAVVYIHPWEVDPAQPRIHGAGWKSRFRHYTNLRTTMPKLRSLVATHSFGSVSEVIASLDDLPAVRPADLLVARGKEAARRSPGQGVG